MSTDVNAIGATSQSSLLDAFGEYYRNRHSDNGEQLRSIFEQAERKIHAGKISNSGSILDASKNLRIFKNGKAISFTSNGIKNTGIIKKAVSPRTSDIIKNIHKIGKRGGYAALAIGAAVGLYLLFKPDADKQEESV